MSEASGAAESVDRPTLGELMNEGRRILSRAPFRPSRREAALILAHLLDCGEASVRARSDHRAPLGLAPRYREILHRRLSGEPVAYLFGEREFYGRPFRVDRRVLIPRPETEHLVEAALRLPLPSAPAILDIGTGSGCIAVTLALESPQARVVATDLSLAALQVASANTRHLGAADRVRLVRSDLASGLRLASFDLVVSNPPYVSPEVAPTLSPEVHDFEPHLALYAEDHGRSLISGLLAQMAEARAGVFLLLEIGFDQAEWLRSRAEQSAYLDLLEIVPDYGGIPRVGVLRRRR